MKIKEEFAHHQKGPLFYDTMLKCVNLSRDYRFDKKALAELSKIDFEDLSKIEKN